MIFWVKWIIIFIEAYLLGSLSFSIIVSKVSTKKISTASEAAMRA